LHEGNGAAAQVERGRQVCPDDVVPFRGRDLEERAISPDADVRYQNVDAAECVNRAVDERAGVVVTGDVGLDRNRFAAATPDAVDDGAHGGLVRVAVDHDLGAERCKALGDR